MDQQLRVEMSLAQGCRLFGTILYVLILFLLSACIIILLNLLNRSGGFALLSGFFGALLYCALTLPRILFSWRRTALALRQAQAGNTEMQTRIMTRPAGRQPTVGGLLGNLLLFSLLAAAAFIGLYFLRGQSLVFALISAVLGLCFCFSLFQIGAAVLGLFLIRRGRARNASFEQDSDSPSNEDEHETDETTL